MTEPYVPNIFEREWMQQGYKNYAIEKLKENALTFTEGPFRGIPIYQTVNAPEDSIYVNPAIMAQILENFVTDVDSKNEILIYKKEGK